MSWLNDYTKPKWPLWCRLLTFGGLFVVLPLLIITTSVLTPILLTKHHRHQHNPAIISNSTLNLVHQFENKLKLQTEDTLQLEKVYQELAQQSQCNYFLPSIDDTLFVFQFHLRHSSSVCKNQLCRKKLDASVYHQLHTITYFPIQISYSTTLELNLCSIVGFPNTGNYSKCCSKKNQYSCHFTRETSSTDLYTDPISWAPAVRIVTTSAPSASICQSNSSDRRNKWIIVGNMSEAIMDHRSTLVLEENSILITGGAKDQLFFSDAVQNYQFANQSLLLRVNKSMIVKRFLHSTDRLPLSGLILLTGTTPISTSKEQTIAELLDPISGQTKSIEMLTNRRFHTSVVIPTDDKVVLIGGNNYSSTVLSTGDVFNGTHFIPILNTMMVQRIYHTATYIPTLNKVLIIGGRDAEHSERNTYNTIEFYDVTSNMFERLPNITMTTARARHTATYIPSPVNKLLIIGGENNESHYLDSCELFDIQTLTFTKYGNINFGRYDHQAILLNNHNNILITDGISNSISIIQSEIFSLKTMSACQAGEMNTLRERFTSTLIPSTGEVLVCGGRDVFYSALNSCELYVP
ncbi:unnamed protein product [Adineta ricciae]|uniref:Uncharacterized protein n=1 Tax=Adineta ricciae TaxID=249248 RepID=A0A813SDU8_ADIRI|nr:unnamed protein product [Adineta ricciae]